jgi:hypothetical protein
MEQPEQFNAVRLRRVAGKKSGATDCKSNADQVESRANPGKEGSFGCEVNP